MSVYIRMFMSCVYSYAYVYSYILCILLCLVYTLIYSLYFIYLILIYYSIDICIDLLSTTSIYTLKDNSGTLDRKEVRKSKTAQYVHLSSLSWKLRFKMHPMRITSLVLVVLRKTYMRALRRVVTHGTVTDKTMNHPRYKKSREVKPPKIVEKTVTAIMRLRVLL